MKRVGVLVGVLVGLLAPWSVWAQCSVSAPSTFSSTTDVAILDAPGCTVTPASNGVIATSTIEVTGAPIYPTNIDVTTQILHPETSDLQIMLTSPTGRTVTLSSNNPFLNFGAVNANPNEFANVIWDDQSDPGGQLLYTFNNNLVTDRDPVVGAATRLAPEEPLSAFVGENPNGTWTLSIVDQCNLSAGGTLDGWSLSIAGFTALPTIETQDPVLFNGGSITDNGSTIFATSSPVSISGTPIVVDVDLVTNIPHADSDELQMTLSSPASTFVTLNTRNVGPIFDPPTLQPNNYSGGAIGTTWNDSADPDGLAGHAPLTGNDGLASDHPFAPNVAAVTLAPEEALGAFIGQNPNGTWLLVIADRAAGDTGTLQTASLVLKTADCPATPTPANTPTVTPTPTGTLTPNPTVTIGPPPVATPTPVITPTPAPTVPLVVCNGVPATVVGTGGPDFIVGSDADDVIVGRRGSDVISGGNGADIICGGAGADTIRGGANSDFIRGGPGPDQLFGGGDRDVLLGNRGDDALNGGGGEDTCIDDQGNNSFGNCEN